MGNNKKDRVKKIAGYAQRVFFNDNIEYRDFSPNLVGNEFASNGGTPLFTNGNFFIDANLDPKPNVVFQQGAQSQYYTKDDVVVNNEEVVINKNINTSLNLDLSNPLTYVWYGSASELIRASLEEISENWPAAIYVNNSVGSISGNNITNYSYNIVTDESTFTVSTNYFNNPYGIKYTADAVLTGTSVENTTLRNFTINYKSYVIEHNGIIKKIKSIVPSTQATNSTLTLTVEGNPFPELTGFIISQISFLNAPVSGSIPFFIKPNEVERELFFTSLNDLQNNLLNRNTYPQYTSVIIAPKVTDQGVIVTTTEELTFPILEDGYNLNFFDSYYLSYLDKINNVGVNYDENNTDLIIRKYTAEVISSFDTVPRGDGNNLVLDGEKATKLLRIYGVSFDEVKKYINGIKFAHVVTYDKKNNVPDALVKDLSHMLGLDPISFVTTNNLTETVLPISKLGSFSGSPASMSQKEVDTELYRRLILNIAWIWKSKGTRKAIEFLFRFIGAPESLVNFNEYIVLVDKPLDMNKIKELLLFYTGDVDTSHIPYDDNGYPVPPKNGDLVILDYVGGVISGETAGIIENPYTEMYFQKAGGWYRETFGINAGITTLKGNNPHVGQEYDGGNEYLNHFSKCYIPNFTGYSEFNLIESINKTNVFVNYNYGIFNNVTTNTFFTEEILYDYTNNTFLQDVSNCLDVSYSLIETPVQPDGKSVLEQERDKWEKAYNAFLEQIRVLPYLRYSPEFIKVKNNYEEASKNFNEEIRTENCNTNLSLEICVVESEPIGDPKDPENPENPSVDCCDDVIKTYKDGYLILTDATTGEKISGNRLSCCCNKSDVDGLPAKYVSYEDQGRIIEYCGVEPCSGNPTEVREDGVVIFSLIGNNYPNDIVIVEDSCYQLCSDDGSCYQYQSTKYCRSVVGADINTEPEKVTQWANENKDTEDFFTCFKRTECSTNTIVSSPECCAWHGYESKLERIKNDDGTITIVVVCVDKEGISTSTVSTIETEINRQKEELNRLENEVNNTKLPSKENQKANLEIIQKKKEIANLETQKEIVKEKEQLNIVPQIESGYDKYEPYSNRNANVDQISVLSTKKSLINEVSVVKTNGDAKVSDITSDFYSPFEELELNNTKDWEVESIDDYGRVSFSKVDDKGEKHILDWNTPQSAGGNLYVNIGEEKGYTYSTFEITNENTLKQIPPIKTESPNGGTKTPPSVGTTRAITKESHISCDDVDDVTILFGSENDLGFQLPEEKDCECSVDISFDYLLKYETENLNECVDGKIGCEVAILNKQTIENIDCRNFVTFTNNSEDSSKLSQNYPSYKDENETKNKIEVWQSTTQLEPSVECCNVMGGVVISNIKGWINTIEENSNIINKEWKNLFNNEQPETIEIFDRVLVNYKNRSLGIQKYISSTLFSDNQECIKFTPVTRRKNCFHDPFDYITTDNVCILPLKTSCGLWSKMFEEYKYYEEQLNSMKIEAENCIKLNDSYNDIATETDKLIVDTKTKQTENQNESLKEIETIEKNISSIDEQLTKIDNQILEKQNDNDSINQSLGDTLPQSDCTIYEETIKQLNSFDVQSYCRNQNSERIKDGTEFYNTAYESCVKSKNDEINKDIQTYNQLLELCVSNNRLNIQLEEAKRQNNLVQIDVLEKQINENNQKINTLTNETNSVVSTNENLQSSKLQQNNKVGVIDTTAKILGKNPDQITDSSGEIKLTESEKVSLKIKEEQNKSEINKLNRTKELLNQQKAEQEVSKEKVEKEYTETQTQYNEDIGVYQGIKGEVKPSSLGSKCCEEFLKSILKNLEVVQSSLQEIEERTINCYNDWYKIMYESLNKYNSNSGGNYIDYIDDLKLNFKLFVDNGGIQNLPYTSSVNPIWEWNPSQEFSGVYFEGTEVQVTEVEQSIIQSIVNSGSKPSETIFEPEWQTLNFSLPECVCKDLRRLYPDKRFKFGIEIENFECAVCLVVDNIKVNVTDCNTVRRLSFNDCMIPELSCVIDNKKSWVYFEDGVKEEVKYPDGECNVNSENNFTVTKLVDPQERLWKELEYRYTEYDINHSDLLLNTKSATFAIDPANAIECDVYNFWKNIDCDDCPTSCVSGETVVYSDSVISGDTLIPYSLPLTGGTTTNILNLDGGDAIIYLDSRNGVYSNDGTIPANLGDDVYQWNDISLYNNNAIQTAAGDRPTYVSGGTCFGEQNVLYFDRGENDFMSVTNDSSFDSLTGLTLFMYFTKNDSQSWGVNDVVTQYSDSDATFDGWGVDVQQYFGESYLRFVYNDPADPPSGYNFLEIRTPFLDNGGPNECTLYTFRVGGSDGTQSTTIEGWTGTSLERYSIGTGNGITYAPTTEPLSIGGSATSTLPSPVNFATYILYNGALTDEAIAEVQNYIISNIGSGSTSSEFNCETYTTILNEQVTELKNDFYTLTADYNGTLNASYKDLLEKGGSLSEFKILDNNCNTNNIVIGNDSEINNLFGTLVEEADGTLSFWEIYVYDSSTPYSNGTITDIGNGLSAQTFNQTSSFDSECCSSINSLITSKGVNGLGVDKNYVWNDTLSKCTWLEIDNGEGDCSYCETSIDYCNPVCPSGYTYNSELMVCENQVDCDEYLSILNNEVSELDSEKNQLVIQLKELLSEQKARQAEYEQLRESLFELLAQIQEIIALNPTAITVGDLSATSFYPLTTYFASLITDINNILSNLEGLGIYWSDDWNDILTQLGDDSSVLTDIVDSITSYIAYINNEFSQIISEFESQKQSIENRINSIDEQINQLFNLIAQVEEECAIDPSLLFTLTSTTVSVGTSKEVCINPLDYLDFDPSTINVKEVFDELVVSNLIDAKSRQVISSYPTLKLFYLLYLNATNCGKDLSGKLTYNSLFEFMDKIGDYWLDLLEQVVPATTIWEGCDNSGKIYRNTVFDQNKYAYRRYVLNFNDSEICPLSDITNDSIGSATVHVEVNEKLLTPDNADIRKIKQVIKDITNEIYDIKEDIEKLECRLEALLLIENPTKEQQNEIAKIQEELVYLNRLLSEKEEKLKELNEELIKLEQEFIENQNNFDETVEGCQKFSEQITIAKQNLEDQYTVGTLEYERQRNYIAGLENQYRKCVKQKQTQISYYDTVFITHINDSNEYEGNVTVVGDPEWEKGGHFYQSELIHNCEKIYMA